MVYQLLKLNKEKRSLNLKVLLFKLYIKNLKQFDVNNISNDELNFCFKHASFMRLVYIYYMLQVKKYIQSLLEPRNKTIIIPHNYD